MKNIWGKELTFPEDVLYSPELLWVKPESGDKLRIGISDLGVKAVKRLMYIRIKPRVGSRLEKGDMVGLVETSKMVWEITTPVSGVVVAVNEDLARGNPAALERDPYGEGWILQMKMTRETGSQLQQLLKGGEPETKTWIAERAEAIIPLEQTA